MEQTLLADKYRLVSLLGRGGMGSVWRAEHLALKAPIAVKLMDPSIAEVPEALARFHREAQSAAALRSPHVVQILDHGVDPLTNTPFIVMELLDGESLSERIKRLGTLDPPMTARVITQVARALTKAHGAGIVHRDLKPDNIFLVRNEDEEIAKVLDFGIAKSEAHGLGTATVTGAVMGTAYYMSPEQISGAKDVDFRTDLWALGVIAHECLVGQRPFEADTLGAMVLRICTQPVARPSRVGPVPQGFDEWFERAVSRDVSQRFQSARELADALKVVCRSTLLLADSRLGADTADLASSKTVLGDTGGRLSGSVGGGSVGGGSGRVGSGGAASSQTAVAFPNTANPVSHSTDSAVAHLRANRGGLAWGAMFGGGLLVVGLAALGVWSLLGSKATPNGAAAPTAASLAMAAPMPPMVLPVGVPAQNAVSPVVNPAVNPAPTVDTSALAPAVTQPNPTSEITTPPGAPGDGPKPRARSTRPTPAVGGPQLPAPVVAPAPAAPPPPAAKPVPKSAPSPPPAAAKPPPSPFDGVLNTRK